MSNLPPASDNAPLDETQVAAGQPKKGKPPRAAKAPKRPRTPGRASGCLGALFNLLTVLFLVLTFLSAGLVAALFQYPGVLAFVRGGSAFMPATDLPIAQVLLTPTPPAANPTTNCPRSRAPPGGGRATAAAQ